MEWIGLPGVREVCSVSECFAPGPDGWIEAWKHNAWGLFDDPDAARSVVLPEDLDDFAVHAYETLPVRFVGGRGVPFETEVPAARALDGGFVPLGYDVVSRSGDFFSCSPLSCNRWASKVGANAFCLIDERDEALRLAAIAESSGCEPGDYYVLRVWRERDARAAGPT